MILFTERPDVSDIFSPITDPGEYEFASLMRAREDALHSIFGHPFPDGNIKVDPELSFDFPGGGVYSFPPRNDLTEWHYVTSGLSQPLDDADEDEKRKPLTERYSGFGIELVISTRQPVNWAVDV